MPDLDRAIRDGLDGWNRDDLNRLADLARRQRFPERGESHAASRRRVNLGHHTTLVQKKGAQQWADPTVIRSTGAARSTTPRSMNGPPGPDAAA